MLGNRCRPRDVFSIRMFYRIIQTSYDAISSDSSYEEFGTRLINYLSGRMSLRLETSRIDGKINKIHEILNLDLIYNFTYILIEPLPYIIYLGFVS